MSKLPVVSAPFESSKPILPCPTSPLQQTEGESWEHTSQYRGDPSYDRYRNDHITDRVIDSPDTEPDYDGD